VPDEMLDREMDGVYILNTDVWDDGRPYILCSLRPKPEDKALGTVLFNAQALFWDLQTHVQRRARWWSPFDFVPSSGACILASGVRSGKPRAARPS